MKVALSEHPQRTPEAQMLSLPAHARPVNPRLLETHEIFRKWLGREYDIQLLDIVLATAAANLMRHEPVWLMIVGGSGTGKTEVAKSLAGCGAHIVSTISSEGALLSGAKTDGKSKEATGGLLREVGPHGLVVLKDFTSILSMPDRTNRPQILAALREIHDGIWTRKVGTEGGRTITWKGHMGIVGCCTTAWDQAHTAIAAMGDRFTVARINSRDMDMRMAAGRQAMSNLGKEKDMVWELREAARLLLERIGPHTKAHFIPNEVYVALLAACNTASMARTPTEYDMKGKTTFSHDPEAPTRLPRSLIQMIQGALAIGIRLDDAFNLALRCVRDSIPSIRLECIQHMAKNADSSVSGIMLAIQRPWNAVDRAIQALYSAGMVLSERVAGDMKDDKPRVCYNLRPEIDVGSLWMRSQLVTPDEIADAH